MNLRLAFLRPVPPAAALLLAAAAAVAQAPTSPTPPPAPVTSPSPSPGSSGRLPPTAPPAPMPSARDANQGINSSGTMGAGGADGTLGTPPAGMRMRRGDSVGPARSASDAQAHCLDGARIAGAAGATPGAASAPGLLPDCGPARGRLPAVRGNGATPQR